jgi:ABC-type sulfate/molybdate transport systems ATPase subunit
VGDTAVMPVTVSGGEVWYEGRKTGLMLAGHSDGPADLFVRPWDLSLNAQPSHGIPGLVKAVHRNGASYRLSVVIGAGDLMVEVDAPVPCAARRGDIVTLAILRGQAFR